MEIVEAFFSFTRDVIGFFLFSKCSKAEHKTVEDLLQLFYMDRTGPKRKENYRSTKKNKSYIHNIRIKTQETQNMLYSILIHMKDSRYRCATVSVTHPLVGKHLAPYTCFT